MAISVRCPHGVWFLEDVIVWQCDQASWHKLLHAKSIERVPCSDGAVDEQVCRGIDNLRGKEISSCKKEISIDKDGDIGQKNMGDKSKDKCRDQCMATLMIILTDYDQLTMRDYGFYMMTMTKRTWETNPSTMLQTGNPPREDSRHWWIQSRMNISCRLRIILRETSMKGRKSWLGLRVPPSYIEPGQAAY